jgi:hypothetical protein
MYGIINKAIEELVHENFGPDQWESIKKRCGIDIDFFISNEPYDDDITYMLAQAIADEMNLSLSEVLITFGEWWILKTTREKYGALLATGGQNLKDFLIYLPDFHTRVMLMYPKLTPPEFKVSNIEEKGIHLHYYSKRKGLQEFVRGLIQGLSIFYNEKTNISLISSRDQGNDHDIFSVQWE